MERLEKQLFQACEYGRIEEVQQLLINNPQVNINWQNNYGETPFYIACRNGQVKVVKILLDNKRVDVNKVDRRARITPLNLACSYQNIEVVKLLLRDQRVDIYKGSSDYLIPLNIAHYNGDLEIVEYILACRKVMNLVAKDLKRVHLQVIYGFRDEEQLQNRERNRKKISELLEAYERNPNETRFKLRIQLGLAGKFHFLFFFLSIEIDSKFLNPNL